MQTNTLKRSHANKKHVQMGRGGKRGKTAGRGTKGQNARSGHRKRPELRDIIKKIPKRRGFGKNRAASAFPKPRALGVNLKTIELRYTAGETVSPTTLITKGIISNVRAHKGGVKILGTGAITKKLSFEKVLVSASAKNAIETAGGTMV